MTTVHESAGHCARRAASLYDGSYARRYRDRDDQLLEAGSYHQFIDWLRQTCGRFERPVDALDLGCGTGRYFWGLENVAGLVGLDASEAMLIEARHPVREDRITAGTITLVNGDLLAHDFEAGRFGLVYSIGVLAEHVPLDDALVARVWRWLQPGGRFAFTTVHPQSPSVARTPPRRLAEAILPFVPGASGRMLHARLMAHGMYGDERWVRDRLTPGFEIESLERFTSDVHLHARCVARKVAA